MVLLPEEELYPEEKLRSNMIIGTAIGSTIGDSKLAYNSYCSTATTTGFSLSEQQE